MAREGRYDPYAEGGGGRMGFGLNMLDMIRYIAAGLGVIMIIVGMVFAVRVFGVVLGIIDSPESFVANLDAWSNADTEEDTTPRPPPPPPGLAVDTTSRVPLTDEVPAAAPGAPSETAEPERVDAAGSTAAPAMPRVNPNITPPRPIRPPPANEFEGSFNEFLDLVREGRMGRVAGAVIIVLLLTLLSKIPFAFMRIGVQLLSASGGFKRS